MESKDVEVRFDEGPISSDAGLAVMIQWLQQNQVLERYAEILNGSNERDSNRTDHSNHQLLRQRVLQIMAGYGDANDCDRLREEPMFRVANQHQDEDDDPNASQPTMS